MWSTLGQEINGSGERQWFGYDVEMSVDGSRFVAGTPFTDGNSFSGEGKIEVYELQDTNWVVVFSVYGSNSNDNIGTNVTISGDGRTIATGNPYSYVTDFSEGKVALYREIEGGTDWEKISPTIHGEASSQLGYDLDLNEYGNKLVIGIPYAESSDVQSVGNAVAFEFLDSAWLQVHQEIWPNDQSDEFISSVTINSNGSFLAVSYSYYNQDIGDSSYSIQLYHKGLDAWEKVADTINLGDKATYPSSIDINANGDRLMVKSRYRSSDGFISNNMFYQLEGESWKKYADDIIYDGNFESWNDVHWSNNGSRVDTVQRVAESNELGNANWKDYIIAYELENHKWQILGDSLLYENRRDVSVSLSADGLTIAVVKIDSLEDYVQLYEWQNDQWILKGDDIRLGVKYSVEVKLNGSGNRLIISDPNYDLEDDNIGMVKVFDFNNGDWKTIGDPVLGARSWESFGEFFDINEDGSVIFIGGYYDERSQTGDIQAYRLEDSTWLSFARGIDSMSLLGISSNFMSVSADGSSILVFDPWNEIKRGVRVYEYSDQLLIGQPESAIISCSGLSQNIDLEVSEGVEFQWQILDDKQQWQDLENDSFYNGVQTTSLIFTTDTSFNEGYYRCILSKNDRTKHTSMFFVSPDKVDPDISCENFELELSDSYTMEFDDALPSVIELCDYTIINDWNEMESLEGESFGFGSYPITWMVVDANGNESTCSMVVNISGSTTLNELDQDNEFILYPNPASDKIIVEGLDTEIDLIEIRSVVGTLVYKAANIKSPINVKTTVFKSGIYTVSIHKNHEQFTRMFVVEYK